MTVKDLIPDFVLRYFNMLSTPIGYGKSVLYVSYTNPNGSYTNNNNNNKRFNKSALHLSRVRSS